MSLHINLSTARLVLRPFNTGDMDDLLALLRDKEVNRYLPWWPCTTKAMATAFFRERMVKGYQYVKAQTDLATLPAGGNYFWAICTHATTQLQPQPKSQLQPQSQTQPRVIGYISLSGGAAHDLGYALAKEYWGQGIVTEAAQAVVNYLKQAGVPFITATHDVLNVGSGKVMQKLGMYYCYSYREQWQPKDISVVFRCYQLNLDVQPHRIYREYYQRYAEHCVEKKVRGEGREYKSARLGVYRVQRSSTGTGTGTSTNTVGSARPRSHNQAPIAAAVAATTKLKPSQIESALRHYAFGLNAMQRQLLLAQATFWGYCVHLRVQGRYQEEWEVLQSAWRNGSQSDYNSPLFIESAHALLRALHSFKKLSKSISAPVLKAQAKLEATMQKAAQLLTAASATGTAAAIPPAIPPAVAAASTEAKEAYFTALARCLYQVARDKVPEALKDTLAAMVVQLKYAQSHDVKNFRVNAVYGLVLLGLGDFVAAQSILRKAQSLYLDLETSDPCKHGARSDIMRNPWFLHKINQVYQPLCKSELFTPLSLRELPAAVIDTEQAAFEPYFLPARIQDQLRDLASTAWAQAKVTSGARVDTATNATVDTTIIATESGATADLQLQVDTTELNAAIQREYAELNILVGKALEVLQNHTQQNVEQVSTGSTSTAFTVRVPAMVAALGAAVAADNSTGAGTGVDATEAAPAASGARTPNSAHGHSSESSSEIHVSAAVESYKPQSGTAAALVESLSFNQRLASWVQNLEPLGGFTALSESERYIAIEELFTLSLTQGSQWSDFKQGQQSLQRQHLYYVAREHFCLEHRDGVVLCFMNLQPRDIASLMHVLVQFSNANEYLREHKLKLQFVLENHCGVPDMWYLKRYVFTRIKAQQVEILLLPKKSFSFVYHDRPRPPLKIVQTLDVPPTTAAATNAIGGATACGAYAESAVSGEHLVEWFADMSPRARSGTHYERTVSWGMQFDMVVYFPKLSECSSLDSDGSKEMLARALCREYGLAFYLYGLGNVEVITDEVDFLRAARRAYGIQVLRSPEVELSLLKSNLPLTECQSIETINWQHAILVAGTQLPLVVDAMRSQCGVDFSLKRMAGRGYVYTYREFESNRTPNRYDQQYPLRTDVLIGCTTARDLIYEYYKAAAATGRGRKQLTHYQALRSLGGVALFVYFKAPQVAATDFEEEISAEIAPALARWRRRHLPETTATNQALDHASMDATETGQAQAQDKAQTNVLEAKSKADLAAAAAAAAAASSTSAVATTTTTTSTTTTTTTSAGNIAEQNRVRKLSIRQKDTYLRECRNKRAQELVRRALEQIISLQHKLRLAIEQQGKMPCASSYGYAIGEQYIYLDYIVWDEADFKQVLQQVQQETPFELKTQHFIREVQGEE